MTTSLLPGIAPDMTTDGSRNELADQASGRARDLAQPIEH